MSRKLALDHVFHIQRMAFQSDKGRPVGPPRPAGYRAAIISACVTMPSACLIEAMSTSRPL